MAWGYHLTVDAYECDPNSIRDQFQIQRFVERLVPAIGMKAYGGPLIIKFGTGATQGYTLVQLIETSNICAHFAEGDNSMYFDLFSCKMFDEKIVQQLLQEFFAPKQMDSELKVRGERLPAPGLKVKRPPRKNTKVV